MTRLIAVYGHFPGGDPRTFYPDPELCTAQEIMNWKLDCRAWNKGNPVECPPPGRWYGDSVHVLEPRYGIGTYYEETEDED